MTSQSPAGATDEVPADYADAWRAISVMVTNGASWSAREHNHVFLNLGEHRFADVSALSTANGVGDGRAIATLDWDDDGRLDFFLKSRTAPRVQFFRNEIEPAGAFLAIELEGVHCNRDAIGARVYVEAGGRTLVRTLYAGSGYLSQSSKRLHFGLDATERVDRIEVRWPDGSRDSFGASAETPGVEGFAANQRYRIVQGADVPVLIAARVPVNWAQTDVEPLQIATGPRARVPLVEKIGMKRIPVPAFDDSARRVSDLAGGPVLLNLWSTTCASCLSEFGDLRDARGAIDESGLRIVTLAVDGEVNRERAFELLDTFGLRPGAGFVTEPLLKILEILIDEVINSTDALPLPTSLLLDREGNLVALYPGKLNVEELLLDVKMLKSMDPSVSGDSLLVRGFRLFPRKRDLNRLGNRLNGAGFPGLGRFYLNRQKRR